jgi:type III pantothenate kinase
MLLAIDVGNTHTVLGLFEGAARRGDWRLPTRKDATEDELGVIVLALLERAGFAVRDVDAVIVASVVPGINGVLGRTVRDAFGCEPLFIGPGTKTGMPILYENPHDVGADRIVNAVAAAARFGAPVVVLDFGTATTFDVVDPRGAYLGGVIAPGLGLSAEALFSRAARLHRVDIVPPARVIGRNMEQSLQSGLFLGYVALVEGLVARILDELGQPAPVVATGGLAEVFAKHLSCLAAVDMHLTLDGLRILWERNRR